jgi:4-alpha-glucanotransferase
MASQDEVARRCGRFRGRQAWWIEEYSLFRAVHAAQDERPWTEWPAALRYHEHAAVADARQDLASHVLFHQFVQWIAHTQWRRARGRTHGVALFGDLPFMVDGDSADVSARQHQFHLDVSAARAARRVQRHRAELGNARTDGT